MMMRLLLCLGLITLLQACASQKIGSVLPTNPGESINPTQVTTTPTSKIIEDTPVKTISSQTHILSPTATSTSLPVGNPISICSPLELHPLDDLSGIISAPYKPPPKGHEEERHHGIDFGYWHFEQRDSMQGEIVQSILPGKVAASIKDKYPYGNMVIIETQIEDLPEELIALLPEAKGKSLYTLYAHLNQPPVVNLGDYVESCQTLGEVGKSGNTDIPHLHLETRIGPPGSVFPSMRFYDTRATLKEMETYTRWRTSGEFFHFDPMIIFSFRTSQ